MASKDPGNISVVYSEALYDVAKEQNVIDRVEQEMLAILKLTEADIHIRRFFETPTITLAAKTKILRVTLKDMHLVTQNFILVALEHGRVPSMLQRIIKDFHALCNERAGIAEMDLRSASKFEPAEMDKLKKTIEAKLKRTVIIREVVHPELLGGFILSHGNNVWDASKISQLGRLVNKMEELKASAALVK